MDEPIEIISTPDLVNYLKAAGVTTDPSACNIYVPLANGLVSEAWSTPEDPIPRWVKAIALEVAARPARNPKGLSSWTRNADDTSRTERLPDAAARAGIYLLDSEETKLGRSRDTTQRPHRFRSVRTRVGY